MVGEQTARDTETVSETKWVNEPDTLTVQEITHKDYTGYKFGSYDPETLPEIIEKNGVIKVNYVKDDSQTKTISYTVEHWVVGEQTARDTETVSETKWVNEPDTLTVQEITHKDYTGYKFGSYDPETLPEIIEKNGVIKVNYVKDDSQTKTISYTVEHWVVGEQTARDTETVSETKWVNEPDTLTVQEITHKDYTGYKFGSYDPETLPEIIEKNGVIKVNYVKDDSQTKTISYTVEHWVVGEQTARDTETVSETKWVNDPDILMVQEITHKSYSGYRFGNYNPEQLPETIAKDGIIKVNYVKTSSGGSSGGGGGSTPGRVTPSEGGPGVTIMPEDVPLAQLPGSPVDTTLIDDGEIPLAGLPKTGQSSVKSTLTMMMSGIFLVLTAMSKKRKEEDS